MREDNFWHNAAYNSAYTLRIKNFIKITVSRIVSKINAFLRFTQNGCPKLFSCHFFQDVRQKGRKMIFGKWWQLTAYILGGQKFVEISLSHNASKINTFFALYRFSRRPPKMAGKKFFGKNWRMTLQIPCGPKNVSHIVFEILNIFHFHR